eukprot:gene4066-7355_t
MHKFNDEYLTFELVIQALNLEPKKIHAIYQFGSRVYQSHTKNSDYDLFIVYGTEFIDVVKENEKMKIGGHISDIKTFKNTIINHNAVSISVLWLDEKYVVFENEHMARFRKNFMIDLKKLERAYLREEHICLLKSRRLYKLDKKKSLKNLVHGVRYLLFGIQAAKTGKIYDFTVGNKYYEWMLTLDYETWDEYHKKFETIYEKLHEELKEFVFKEKSKYYEKYNGNSKEKLELIHFLKENELKMLTKIFSTQIVFLDDGLISFIADPIFSNMECTINQESQSKVILDQDFRLVTKSFSFSSILENFEFKRAIKKPKKEYLLFFRHKKFQVHPKEESDQFWKLLDESKFKDIIDIKKSYIFIIDEHGSLKLIGIIDLHNAENVEISEEFCEDVFSNFSSIEEIKKDMKVYDPFYNGYIIIDEWENHYHLEYPLEIFSRKIDVFQGDSDSNVENILEIIRFHSNHEEVLKFFEGKEIYETVKLMMKVYQHHCEIVNSEFEKLKNLKTSKEFSLSASKTQYKHELLGLYNTNSPSLQEYWEKLKIQKLKTPFKREMKLFSME